MRRHAARSSAVVLIPALDEAGTVAEVVAVARAAEVGPVLVIDDGSTDGTAAVAAAAGAEVLRLDDNRGKGGAVAAGARARRERVVVLLDADLTGLTPAHVHALLAPVVNGASDMTRGVFVGGRWRTNVAQQLVPVLNGQRAMRRADLLAVEGLDDSRYGVEVAIFDHAKRHGWRTEDVPLAGVSQVMKEEKRGTLRGTLIRLRMYAEIVGELVRRALHPRRPGRAAPPQPAARRDRRNAVSPSRTAPPPRR
jgi:glycosyltransferase involved in cell wall biosynthesis